MTLQMRSYMDESAMSESSVAKQVSKPKPKLNDKPCLSFNHAFQRLPKQDEYTQAQAP